MQQFRKLPIPRLNTLKTVNSSSSVRPKSSSKIVPHRFLPKKKRKTRKDKKVKKSQTKEGTSQRTAPCEGAPRKESEISTKVPETKKPCAPFDLADVTRIDSALPETILATEEEEQDEEVETIDLTRESLSASEETPETEGFEVMEESGNKGQMASEKPKVSEPSMKVTSKDNARRALLKKRKTREDGAGASGKPKRSKSSYSIAALCQISVNIGENPVGETTGTIPGIANSPGVASLNSVEGTASPVGTPAPPRTPTPIASFSENIKTPPATQNSEPNSMNQTNTVIQELNPPKANEQTDGKGKEKHAQSSKETQEQNKKDLSVFEFTGGSPYGG